MAGRLSSSGVVVDRSVRCELDRAEAFRYLGHAGQDISMQLQARIDEAFAQCERDARPMWCYAVFPVEVEGEVARLLNSALEIGVAGSLEPLSRMCACAVMACTIGLGVDREARRLSLVDATAALTFDAAASSLAESCADSCERAVGAFAANAGLHAGQRTSPGYGDLPLAASRDIVRVLDAGKHVGISVVDSGQLYPVKSVTALVGLFEREEDARRARRSCAECVVAKNCAYLKAGNPCNELY